VRWLQRRPPALWLALVAALGVLVALATAAPPAVTYRSNTVLLGAVAMPKAKEQCTTLQVLPDGTRAVRVHVAKGRPVPARASLVWPGSVRTVALSAPMLVDGGTRAVYRLPEPVRTTEVGGSVCFEATERSAAIMGSPPAVAVDLLGDERGSWLSAIPLLADRASFGRGFLGGAAPILALLCIVGAWILVVRTAPRNRETPVDRRAIRRVGMVGALMASAFAMTTPAFQAPDEMVHLHYVELLRTTQAVPDSIEQGALSPQIEALVRGAQVSLVAFQPEHRPPWTGAENAVLERQLAAAPAGDAPDVFTNASSQPPGYYAAAAVITSVTGGDILDRLIIIRLLTALLAGLAVAGTVVFARAAVPSAGGLVLIGGLMFACLPMLGFIGGSVNPDMAYTAAAAWALAGIATILRSGLTMRRALWVAVATGIGMLCKLTFLPLLPAILLGAAIAVIREVRAGRGRAVVAPVIAATLVASAIGLPYLLWAYLGDRGLVFGPSNPYAAPVVLTVRELVTYAIELFVGQVGPIKDRIPGSGPFIFLDGLTGRLGWLDYGLTVPWVMAFKWLWISLTALAVVGVLRAIRRRGSAAIEFGLWVIAIVPLLLTIAKSGFEARMSGATGFEQARYLSPIAAIAVAGIGLAVRQLPRVIVPWVAAALCTIGVLHGTALWLVTIGRYFA
jgi:hypothetical protein